MGIETLVHQTLKETKDNSDTLPVKTRPFRDKIWVEIVFNRAISRAFRYGIYVVPKGTKWRN
jgi:hypothetical protein